MLDTGAVVNPKLAGTIQKAIDSGKLFFGGTPKLVKQVPSILPGDPPVSYFEIVF